MIDGLQVRPLTTIADERGAILHMLRADDPHFRRFGEVYFSWVEAGAVKAWKRHHEQTQNLAVPAGAVRVVVFDDRAESRSRGVLEIIDFGAARDHSLVTIPPMVWYGFTALGGSRALIANCCDLPHNPDEADRLPPTTTSIPYDWSAGVVAD